MKKYLIGALGAGLLLTSCQSEEPLAPGSGIEQQVSFKVSLPDVVSTRAGGTNSAAGGVSNNEGSEVKFNVALYLIGGSTTEPVYTASETVPSTGNHTSATFEPTLVIGEQYRVVAYANFDDDTLNNELTAINVTPAINDEQKDEYFANTILTAAPELSATLKRPFGKLRLVAEDLHEAERQYGAEIKSVEVTYQYTRPTVFNAYAELSATDNVYGKFGDYVMTTPQTLTADYGVYGADTNNARTIFVDYIPVNTGDQMMPFTVTVKFEGGKTYTRDFRQDIPVKRNHLTTLKGRLFTMDSDLKLTIEEGFEGETEKNFANDLEWVAANGGTITLTEDVEIDHPVVVNADAKVVINLNGKNIINTTKSEEFGKGEGIIAYGELTINGEGTVQGSTMAVWARGTNNAVVNIYGGTYKGCEEGYAKGGRSVVYASSGNIINFYGGEVKALAADKTSYADKTDGVYAALNVADNNGMINVYGGRFYKQNPAAPGTEPSAWNAAHPNGFVADGYSAVLADDWYVVGKAASNVAELKDALSNAPVVNVEQAIDNGSNALTINGNNLELNMESNKITAGGQGTNNYAFNVYGSEVTVNNANVDGAGFAVMQGSNLTINDGAINAKPGKSGRNMFYVTGNSTVTVKEGDYKFDRTSCYFVYVEAGCTCVIEGGNFFKPLANNASKDSFVNNGSAGTVIITGGTFNVDPRAWVADGYKAVKSGSTWTVVAE